MFPTVPDFHDAEEVETMVSGREQYRAVGRSEGGGHSHIERTIEQQCLRRQHRELVAIYTRTCGIHSGCAVSSQ